MLFTSFTKLRKHNACSDGLKTLKENISKRQAGDLISMAEIIDSNGLEHALWALRSCDDSDKFARLIAAEFAEHTVEIFEKVRPDDSRPRLAIVAARAYANGTITAKERDAAGDAAWDAAWDARAAARANLYKKLDKWMINHIKELRVLREI